VTPSGVNDPLRCDTTGSSNDCATQFSTLVGGSTSLVPEKSTNTTLGLVLEPNNMFSVSADLFQIKLKNTIIAGVNPFQILANLDKYGSLVQRGAVDPNFPNLPGPITQIDQTTLNLGETRMRGVDVDFKFNIPMAEAGKLGVSLAGTYYTQYDVQTPDGSFQNGLDDAAVSATGGSGGVIPRWRSVMTVNWTKGPWGATVIRRYQKEYKDVAGTFEDSSNPAYVARTVAAYDIFDVQGTYSGVKDWRFTLGVKNVFNKNPPYTNNGGQASFQAGYDPSYADPRGRFVYANATFTFK
jgi:iron complex outermembrane recepter protein